MFDIELLRGYYKGAGIKIALIDTGIKKRESDNIHNIERYFYDYDEAYVKESENNDIYSDHGSTCGNYILNIAPQVTLMDINVENNCLEISDDAVCAAIEFAIENKFDIINISLGFHTYSEKLYLVCKKAYEKNVIIIAAAAHDNALIFPADYDNYTVKIVEEDIYEKGGDEKITKINDRLYQVYLNPFVEHLYDEKSNTTSSIVSMGSSIACAYFTAILALYLESRPFIKKEEVINSIFGKRNTDNISKSQNLSSEFIIQEKSVFSIISSYYDYTKYKEMIHKNIVGYYDLLHQKTEFFNEESFNTDNLYVVNPLNYQRVPINNADFKNYNYIGDFKDIDCYNGKTLDKNDLIKNIESPIILIVGVGTDCGKFNIQLELKKQMIENNLSNYCITYNPLGYVFNMDFLKYPDNFPFHDLIYSLNGYIKQIENDSKVEYESIIINVAGGMFPLSRINTNNFGMLYNAYLNALPIDYIIICTNSGIDVSVIKNEIKRLDILGNTDIAIVVSNLSYDEFSIENTEKNTPHIEEKEVFEKGIEEYKNNLKDIPIYRFEDVANGLLYKDIIEKMT